MRKAWEKSSFNSPEASLVVRYRVSWVEAAMTEGCVGLQLFLLSLQADQLGKPVQLVQQLPLYVQRYILNCQE